MPNATIDLMPITATRILRTYVTLTMLSTFASSFIWGINTLFLLDAGLSITEAFAANAFFTLGMVIFEVPTGVVADTVGRRASFLLGSATLFVSTIMYLALWQFGAAFWAWAVVSMLLGLGFTFFSGATEAWLVDGLKATGYKGSMESAFGRGQVATGIAMLSGTVAGGLIAQVTNLGVPYILRAVALALTFVVAAALMQDVGFTPKKGKSTLDEMQSILRASLKHGLGNPPVRWLMLAAPFTLGVGIYAFYAMQPYLLELYGRGESYAIAGLAAAIVAGAQIVGGLLASQVRKLFQKRTSLLLAGTLVSTVALIFIGLTSSFYVALAMLALWAVVFACCLPVRAAFINGLIPSDQRATVLSSDNLLGSAGGIFAQPALGKVADVWSYGASYVVSGIITLAAAPFAILARREQAPSDDMDAAESQLEPQPEAVPAQPPAKPVPGSDDLVS